MKMIPNYFEYKPAFTESMHMAFNRSATQIASIVITSLLGLTSTQILAEFGLSLTLASVLFVAVTTIQLGVQAEFGKRFASKEYERLFNVFLATILVTLVISGIIGCAIWFFPNPFSSKGSIELATNAYQSLKILIFSLPMVGLLTTITFFLESIGDIKKVTVLRIFQVWLQVGLVLTVILSYKFIFPALLITTKVITTAYVISDFVMLIIGLYLVFSQINKRIGFRINLDYFRNISGFSNVFQIGAPVMIGMLGQRFIFYTYANLTASLGIIEASVFSIMNSIVFFFQIPLLGVAHLLTIRLSQARGSMVGKEIETINTGYLRLFLIELLCISSIIFIFQSLVFQLFTKDILVFQLMKSLQFEMYLYFLMNAMLMYTMSSLRGFSDTLKPQLILISLLGVGVLFLHFFFSDRLEMSYIFLSFSVSGFLAAGFLMIRINHLKKAEIFNNKIFDMIVNDNLHPSKKE